MARTPASALQPAVGPTMTPRHQATTTRSRTASDVRNLEGRAQAFTVLTPVRRGWALWLRFNFFFARDVPYFKAKLRELQHRHPQSEKRAAPARRQPQVSGPYK